MESTAFLLRARGVYDTSAGHSHGADTLLIEGGRIRALGRWESLRAEYQGLPVQAYPDAWLYPALINTHVHLEMDETVDARVHWLAQASEERFFCAAERGNRMLRSGVTTVRDAASSWALLPLRHIHSRALPLPALRLAGMPITVTGGHLHFMGEETDGVLNMVRATRERQKRGCDAVKLIVTGGQMTPGSLPERVSMTTEEISAIASEARLLGLPTFAHCLTTEGFVRCMRGNVDCIEHVACFVRNPGNRLLERVWVPEAMEPFAGDSRYFMMGLSCCYHMLDEARAGVRPASEEEDFRLLQEERMFDIFRRCIQLGLRPVCGTDGGTARTYFHETWLELALMTERGGLSAKEAIRVCTQQSAECLGLGGVTGTLRPGLLADLVVLPEDAVGSIRAYAKPACVYAAGVPIPGLDPETDWSAT